MSDWGATQRVPARVVLSEGVVLAGELHLLARATYPSESESPLEMLNRDDPFFALSLGEGGVAFVSKAQVAVVSCQNLEPRDDPDRATAAKLVMLSVELDRRGRVPGPQLVRASTHPGPGSRLRQCPGPILYLGH